MAQSCGYRTRREQSTRSNYPAKTHTRTHAHAILSMLEMFENKHAHIIMHILCKCLTEREGEGENEAVLNEDKWERVSEREDDY